MLGPDTDFSYLHALYDPDKSPAIVEPPSPDEHPLAALIEKHFGAGDATRAFFDDLHEMARKEPGVDFWRGG